MRHRLIIYTRGHTHNCYLDMERAEAEQRYAEMDADKSELQRSIDEPLHINEIEFGDEFEIWCNANEDLNKLAAGIFATLANER